MCLLNGLIGGRRACIQLLVRITSIVTAEKNRNKLPHTSVISVMVFSFSFSYSSDFSVTVTIIIVFQFLFLFQLVILHKICIMRESKTQNH